MLDNSVRVRLLIYNAFIRLPLENVMCYLQGDITMKLINLCSNNKNLSVFFLIFPQKP